MSEAKAYKLYALPLLMHNVERAARYRYSRATPTPYPGYVLIYTDGDQPPGSQEITEDQKEMLTAEDARWLMDSRSAILFEELEAHLREMNKKLPDVIDALETELRRKKEETTNGGE